MRTALISCLETLPNGKRRGFARLGGRSLLSWQVDLARDLGCQRFICLTDAKSEAFEELQDQIQQFGGEFLTISGPLPLVSLLSADQELVVIADGLIAERELVAGLLKGKRGVISLPDAAGIEAGFERIDANHAWGGIFVARGQIGEQLAQMPEDSDTVSLLLRLALQSGVKLVSIDSTHLDSGEWMLLREGAEIVQREQSLLEGSAEQVSWWQPTKALSRRIARLFASDSLERGALVTGTVILLGILAAAGSIYADSGALALMSMAVSIFAFECRDGIRRLRTLLRGAEPRTMSKWFGLLADLLIIAILAWPITMGNWPGQLFLPVLTIGLLRLAALIWPGAAQKLVNDRAIFVAAMAVLTAFDLAEIGLGAISLAIVTLSLYFQRDSQITRA